MIPDLGGLWGTTLSTRLYERRSPEVPGVLRIARGYRLTEAMTWCVPPRPAGFGAPGVSLAACGRARSRPDAARRGAGRGSYLPAVYFRYDFSPTAIAYGPEQRSLAHLLTRLLGL